MESNFWRKCSSCKKEIQFSSNFYQCSVSTCTGNRTGYVFCSVPCFEQHLPGARHRDAAALLEKSPTFQQAQQDFQQDANSTKRRIVPAATGPRPSGAAAPIPKEILIVASKLKNYIKLRSDMNTAANVMDRLSDIVRRHCEDAMDKARSEGRKTVFDRDFKN